jgi:hypothetical protein
LDEGKEGGGGKRKEGGGKREEGKKVVKALR